MQSPLAHDPNLIGCSAKELREIKEYVQRLEIECHDLLLRIDTLEQARSLRLARAIGSLGRRPIPALRQILRLLFRRRAQGPTIERLKHRRFPALDRRALPSVTAVAARTQRTVLMEIAEQCEELQLVMLLGCDPRPADPATATKRIAVGPHDYELVLRCVSRPLLFVDARFIPESSPWFGVFGADDMRLNLSFAGLIEYVRQQGGRVVFVRTGDGLEPPLVADFAQGAEAAPDLEGFLQQLRQA
jgi:hypothetical protein